MISTASMPTRNVSRSCVVRAPAKVNLSLEVLSQRSDGFHDIHSLAIGIGLYDRLVCESGVQPGVTIECDVPDLNTSDNLAARAAERLADRLGLEPAIRLSLEKAIPTGAGLGGGSSDAAAALRACSWLWKAGLSREELAATGAKIGSDIPLFFYLPVACISGRGERVVHATLSWHGWALLILPALSISTGAVYAARIDGDPSGAEAGRLQQISRCRTAAQIAELTLNQLEPALFRLAPLLHDLYESLAALGIGRPRVSGSGSAMYLLFDDSPAAAAAATVVRQRVPNVRTIVAPAPVGEEPVECNE